MTLAATSREVEDDVRAVARIDAVTTILDIVCRTTGMGFAAVARVTQDRWIACQVRDDIAFGLKPGDELAVDTTLCREVCAAAAPIVIDHVDGDPLFRHHPTPARYGLQSYIAVPIVLPDGLVFGTLCAIDRKPAALTALKAQDTFAMFAQLIAFHIDAQRRLDGLDDLRRSEAFVAGILAASPDGVKVLSADGTLEFMNEKGAELFALPGPDAVIGSRLPALWPEPERPKVEAAIRDAAAGRPARIEGYCPTATGQPRWWEVNFAPMAAEAGRPPKIVAVLRDISDRVRTTRTLEKRLEHQARDRDRIWRLSRDMLGVADRDGVWLSVNPAWADVLGWPVEELTGRTSDWLQHPDDLPRVRAERMRLAAGQEISAFETRFRARDGSYRTLGWRAVPFEGLIYAIARDMTEERAREAALRDMEDFTRLALTSVGGVGVWTFDMAEDRFHCDAAVSALYGLDPVEAAAGIPSAGFLANVHPDDRAKLAEIMAFGLAQSGDLELEYRIRHPDGSVRWVLSRGHTYHGEDGRPTRRTGVGIETTRQRLMEDQLRQSQKMEAVGQLTGGLAHDFNNLLAGISGSLEMLQKRVAQGRFADLDRYLVAAQGASRRAAALTHRLLAFSRRQTLDPKSIDVHKLVVGMADLIRRTVGPAIAVETAETSDLWNALVDPSQLENALLNLCINARDAMPDGGRITITTANHGLDPRAARERDLPPGQSLSICVSDTGTGMTPEVMARAFDPFFTTKPLGMGTGLGLSMIYGFARQSGGHVRIRSEVGRGTTVCIYLPRHHGAETAPEASGALGEVAGAEAGETVLVIDDEPTVRLLVSDLLRDFGYGALEAEDGASGLEILRSGARIDLLITDVGLPGGMNGRQVADAARQLRPDLKVLFITGYAETAAIGDGQLDPGMAVLTKPFAIDDLAGKIRALIRD